MAAPASPLLLLLLGVLFVGLATADLNSLIGIRGKDFVLLAADKGFYRSIVVMNQEYDKVVELSEGVVLGAVGEQGDVDQFTSFLQRSVYLDRVASAHPTGMSVRAIAHFARRERAEKLRKAQTLINVLLGGVDPSSGDAALFWLDTYGALQEVNFGAHGHAAKFALGLLEKDYRPDLSLEEAVSLVRKSVRQLGRRYLVNSSGAWTFKVVDREGTRTLSEEGAKQGAEE